MLHQNTWICFFSWSYLSDSPDSLVSARSKKSEGKRQQWLRLKLHTELLCFFSPGQHNFIPTYSRKRKAPAVSRCANWYQTSIKVNSEAPDSESLDPPEREKKKKKTEWCIHFKKLEIDWESVVVLSPGFGVQTWHTSKKKQKKQHYSLRWSLSALKACVTTREQLWPYCTLILWHIQILFTRRNKPFAFQPIAASPLSRFSIINTALERGRI